MPISAAISPLQLDAQAALQAFLQDVLGGFANVSVIAAQPNRVGEPSNGNFVIMTPIRFERIETNQDRYQDVKFTGSISGTVLTVSAVNFGTIIPGANLFGVGLPTNTQIVNQLGGTVGGIGTYTITPSQNFSSGVLASGLKVLEQHSILTVQLDFHSADYSASAMAQTVSTAFRDDYGVSFFANLPSPQNNCFPLYADDPAMQPFINENQQYEWRWVSECRLQLNQTVMVPQQFFDLGVVTTVDAGAFPV